MSPTRTRQLAIAIAAAAVTAAVSGLLPSGSADARPVNPDQDPRNDRGGRIAALRAELRETRLDLEAYQRAHEILIDGLDRLDRETERMRDRRAQRRIERTLDATRARVEKEIAQVRDRPDRGDDDGDMHILPVAMSTTDFDRFLKKVKSEAYKAEQLALVVEVGAHNYFTVDQVVALMKAVTYDDTRVEIAVALYPRLIDAKDWYLVYDTFYSPSSKKTLRERLAK